jgi:4-hydroxyphenylpyruvate dioxygenase-like putative hemolysin
MDPIRLNFTQCRKSIAKFLEKGRIHHIAFDVEDIVSEIARLEKGRIYNLE